MKIRFHSSDRPPVELNGGGRFVLSRENFVPAYVKAFRDGILHARAKQAVESLRSCRVCPRDCETDRYNNNWSLQERPARTRSQRVSAFR